MIQSVIQDVRSLQWLNEVLEDSPQRKHTRCTLQSSVSFCATCFAMAHIHEQHVLHHEQYQERYYSGLLTICLFNIFRICEHKFVAYSLYIYTYMFATIMSSRSRVTVQVLIFKTGFNIYIKTAYIVIKSGVNWFDCQSGHTFPLISNCLQHAATRRCTFSNFQKHQSELNKFPGSCCCQRGGGGEVQANFVFNSLFICNDVMYSHHGVSRVLVA